MAIGVDERGGADRRADEAAEDPPGGEGAKARPPDSRVSSRTPSAQASSSSSRSDGGRRSLPRLGASERTATSIPS